jgi:glycosyltransferase involved in cell wall biosynthesis
MKVLIVVPGFPEDFGQIQGGVHSAVNNLLAGFADLPIEVRVVSFNKKLDAKFISKQFASNISLHYYRNWNLGLHILSYLTHGSIILRREIKEFRPDIIHYEEGMAFLLMRTWGVFKVPEILTIHGIIFAEAKLKTRWIDKMYWYLNGIVERVLVPANVIHLSNYSRNIFSENGIRPRRFDIIPNAVTNPFFEIPQKPLSEHCLLYVGVIDENKNLIYLLTGLNELKNRGILFRLLVAGDFISDEYNAIILDFIQQHGLTNQVDFLGWIGQHEIREKMYEADILVVSSKQESLPMVIAESMAAGKLVMASSVGGIPEMIEDSETGFLFLNNDTKNLVNLLERVYNEPALIKIIGKKAQNKAIATYQTKAVAERTVSFYKRILTHYNKKS